MKKERAVQILEEIKKECSNWEICNTYCPFYKGVSSNGNSLCFWEEVVIVENAPEEWNLSMLKDTEQRSNV